ncbi:4Fe-4S binding protein [candidate division KSB1 bacterium]|nr:4Fe-4S binding protein [candidate division KSB1 bacterium]
MIEIREGRCDFCGVCVAVCPADCIELYEAKIVIDKEACTDCLNCVHVCPFEALTFQEDMV